MPKHKNLKSRSSFAGIESLEGRILLANAAFSWSMPDRFGLDNDHDGLIDVPNSPDYAQARSGFFVNLDAGRSTGNDLTYDWRVEGGAMARPMTYRSRRPTAQLKNFAEGDYRVTLTVSEPDGSSSTVWQNVRVQDILVVSLGDSIASGEGNPEIPRYNSPDGWPIWADSPADRARHFSTKSAPAQMALELERSDPHTSVTFVSLASSGAKMKEGLVEHQKDRGWDLPAQIPTAAELLGGRKIDALLLSIGANDIRFSDVVRRLVPHGSWLAGIENHSSWNPFNEDFWTKTINPFDDDFGKWGESTADIQADVDSALHVLSYNFAVLAGWIDTLNVQRSDVYLTEYPDPVSGTDHDILNETNGYNMSVDRGEMNWAEAAVLNPLNNLLYNAALGNHWTFVGGIQRAFQGHGYETADPWIVNYAQAMQVQGKDRGEDQAPAGILHPNAVGHQVMANILLQYVQPRFLIPDQVYHGDQDPGPKRRTAADAAPDIMGKFLTELHGSAMGGALGKMKLRVMNQGDVAAKGTVEVEFYMSASGKLDGSASYFGTVPFKKLRIKPGSSANLKLAFKFPKAVPTGDYYLIVRLKAATAAPEARNDNNLVVSSSRVHVTALSAALAATVSPLPGAMARGRKASLMFTLANTGNVAASGTFDVDLYAVSADDPLTTLLIGTASLKVEVSRGKSREYGVRFRVPKRFASGQYVLMARLRPRRPLADGKSEVVEAMAATSVHFT